jgi:transcriptional regulator with XRE-family HTH domain
VNIDKDEVSKEFGQVIVENRKKIGISQENLAYDAGLARSFLSELERGIKQPSITTLFLLANSLKTSPSKMIKELEIKLNQS